MLPPYLTDDALDDLIARALAEDVGPGDVTTLATIPEGTRATAAFLAKEDGVLAGLYVAERVFAAVDPAVRVHWHAADGDAVARGTVFGTVEGAARSLLTAERTALNLLQRMSGIATATRRMAGAARPARILDTRKTAPGLRLLDKWAVRLGGGENHRIGLFDMILIKDNHIAAAGGVRAAIEAAHRYRHATGRTGLKIEVEARTLDEVEAILATGGVDIILLDNMARRRDDGSVDTSLLREAVARIGGTVQTEASGNVTPETVAAIAATGVDFISSGALTHSVRALDLSLKIDLERASL
ncbi:MAG: nicotinate-nucleotide diphosphorylase (carboxylating) [Rhodothermaceae bacterium]|nr:MAG: nicotinate-nucleotide diphosphorylase (carboxylating) [Rhodothermaceae bacterium]